tara:strand:- start:1096 stop:1389 length:294 start_codon:yes stop_codon:yes gene_type:complete
MIDTDKYEGHSTEYSYEIMSVDDDKEMDATYALLDDAPLILQALTDERAEVKRLRKQVSKAKEWVKSYFINMSGNFNSLEDKVVYDDFMQQMGMKKK